jgi:hypothetical protein
MDMKKKINMCLFMVHDVYINSIQIQIKFEIDMNKDELLKNHTWEHHKRTKIVDCR